jgi:glycosyltransferase involved in cell wall biosynthesis
MEKVTLSVVLATYNEERNLSKCLDSIKQLADEIIIVDGTSTDKTREIAKKYKVKLKVTTNKPNFHINKQMAIDMATCDWILQLDADERVSPELAREIKEKIGEPVNGYWAPRKNMFLGRFLMKGGQYPDYTLRLYRRGKGRLPQVHVHEQAEVVGRVDYLKNALLHYPYENFATYIAKWNRYNDLLAAQIKEKLETKTFFVKTLYLVGYLIVKPAHWFLTTYIRHKGFMDLWPGFVFSFFSALRFPVSYIKYLKINEN